MLKKIIFIVALFHGFLSLAQKDPIYNNYYKKFLKVQFSNPELSKKYLDSILITPSLPDSIISRTYNDLGIHNAVIGNYSVSIHFFNKAYCFDKNISTQTKANILCNIANTQKLFGKFDLALKNLNSAKGMYTILNDHNNLLKIESELSAVYYSKSDYNKALEISSELIPKLEDLGDEKLLNIQLLRLANILFNIGDYKNAILNYNKTIPYFSKNIDNNIQSKYVAYGNIGDCYSELGSSKSLVYLNKALLGFKSISDKRNEFLCISKIGKYFYKQNNYKKAAPYLKDSFEYTYANTPHISIEIYSYYINNLQKQNQYDEIQKLLLIDATPMLSEANLQEKVFYNETMASVYEKLGNKSKEFKALKTLQDLYHEREKKDTFEELQKKLNLYNIKNEINKNKNLELKLFNLKLQNSIILISVLFLIMAVFYVIDKHKKKHKIQQLILLQLEQEKEMHEKSVKFKDIQLKLESEIKLSKERELTALQLRIFEIKKKVIGFLETNDMQLKSTVIKKIVNRVDGYFENEDYWKDFKLRFTHMHPNFKTDIKSKFPTLTKKDIDFLILIKLNLNNKEIATLISISYESVISKRYLLRKKLDFNTDLELIEFLEKI